jgi:hypothetical protein
MFLGRRSTILFTSFWVLQSVVIVPIEAAPLLQDASLGHFNVYESPASPLDISTNLSDPSSNEQMTEKTVSSYPMKDFKPPQDTGMLTTPLSLRHSDTYCFC